MNLVTGFFACGVCLQWFLTSRLRNRMISKRQQWDKHCKYLVYFLWINVKNQWIKAIYNGGHHNVESSGNISDRSQYHCLVLLERSIPQLPLPLHPLQDFSRRPHVLAHRRQELSEHGTLRCITRLPLGTVQEVLQVAVLRLLSELQIKGTLILRKYNKLSSYTV